MTSVPIRLRAIAASSAASPASRPAEPLSSRRRAFRTTISAFECSSVRHTMGSTEVAMSWKVGRRKFFGTAGAGILGQVHGAEAAATTGEDYYDKLGVTKIINAAGTYTALTASIMPPSVQAAVAKAAEHPVRLGDLQKAAGEYLAKKLKCEAAMVTAGAASALSLGTAGCIKLANNCGIRAIPTEVRGLPKHEVIVQ